MATVTTNIAIGVATVAIGAWTAGGSLSTTDVGHTKEPTSLAVSYEDYKVESEQSYGALRSIPIKMTVKLKVAMSESFMTQFVAVLRQPTGNLQAGSHPNQTLYVGAPAEKYHNVVLVTKGTGATTAATRTVSVYKGTVESLGEIVFGKRGEQVLVTTFDCLYDETVPGADKIFRIADSGGA